MDTWTCPRCGLDNIFDETCPRCGTYKPPVFDVNPTPTPTPSSAPSPSPSPEPSSRWRFVEKTNNDGTKTIYDIETGYTIKYSEERGYVAYNDENREVYHIYPDGAFSYSSDNKDCPLIVRYNTNYTIDDIHSEQRIIDERGNEYYVKDGEVLQRTIYNEDGSLAFKDVYNSDGTKTKYTGSGLVKHYNDEGICYRTDDSAFERFYINDRSFTYDGKCYGRTGLLGNYHYDENNNIVIECTNGETIVCGGKSNYDIKKVTADGTVTEYNYNIGGQKITSNGKSTYSRINHIEYDEATYNQILTILNTVGSMSVDDVSSNIESTVNSFPDQYSGDVSSFGSDVKEHFSLAKSLGEMTNYSLLAYQTCDEELRECLYTLVDNLFGYGGSNIGDEFKKAISNAIEDRDNDSILEFKADTNFNRLAANVIPTYIHKTDDGNVLYFNDNYKLIGFKGENIKFEYGGENFTLYYDEKGNAIIRDSKGLPLDIFGEYNIPSGQYGGNQGAFDQRLASTLLNDKYIQDVLERYFPGSSDEERVAYMDKICETACGNVAIANLVFKKFEGKEDEFYNTFGYPMYSVETGSVNFGDSLSIDYNYEPLIADLYCHINTGSTIEEATRNGNGTNPARVREMEKYLNETYDVTINDLSNQYVYLGEYGYTLNRMDGSVYYENGGGHAMILTGYAEDGTPIVSSWGDPYLFKESKGLIDWLLRQRYVYK